MALDGWAAKQGFAGVKGWATSNKTQKQRKSLAKQINSTEDHCQICLAQAAMSEDLQKLRHEEIDEDWRTPLVYATAATPDQPSTTQRPLHRGVQNDVTETFQLGGHIFRSAGAGPTAFLWDSWKSQCWELFTHAGFHTYPHHDASGFGTYSYVRHGCKIWGIVRPRIDPKMHWARQSVFDIMRTMLRPAPSLDYHEVSDTFSVFLLEGDVLIQPPHAIHQVFTPVNSIVSGGHLFPYETLHLTEMARAFDLLFNHVATNADHASAHRTLCRMAMALKYLHKERSEYAPL
jgi:hypothetical protein